MRALSADPRTLKRPESPDRFQATGLMLVALLALSSAACGQPQGGPPPGGPGGLPGGPPGGPGGPGGFSGGPGGPGGFMRMVPVMTALDADGDGEISAAELVEATAHLKKLDVNNDGKLSPEELRPNFPAGPGGFGGPPGGPGGFPGGPGGFGGPPGGGGANGEELATRLMEFDADKDGKLTSEELPARMQGMLTRGDADKDGKLTKEEILAMTAAEGGRGNGGPGGPGGGRGEGGRRGGGGGLFGGPGGGGPGGFVDRMFEFDADKDGKLSREEIQAMAAQFQGGGGGPPAGPGGREGGRREGGDGERVRRPPVEE